MKNTATMMIALGLGALLMGCEAQQTEKDMILEAQFCLDKARDASSADACLGKISGLNSPQAYTLRCAGGFIAAQVTSPEKLSSALNAISEGEGATALLSTLSFPTTELADQTFTSCNLSNQTGMKLMGALAKSATVIAKAAQSLGSCSTLDSCSAAEFENTLGDLIQGLANDDDDAKASVINIVTSVQTVYSSTCGGNVAANGDVCNQINQAVADAGVPITTANPDDLLAIGEMLLAKWKNN